MRSTCSFCNKHLLYKFLLASAVVGILVLYKYVDLQHDMIDQRDGELGQFQRVAIEMQRNNEQSAQGKPDDQLNFGESGELLSSSTNATQLLAHCEIIDVWRLKNASKMNTTNAEPIFYRVKSAPRFECKKNNLPCTNRKMPITGILSFPRSGNSWTRHLISMLTGVRTKKWQIVYYLNRSSQAPTCDSRNETFVVFKDHRPYTNARPYDKMLLLLRNPFKSLISYYQFSKLKGGRVETIDFDVTSKDWDNFIRKKLQEWKKFVEFGIKNPVPKRVLFYEEMLKTFLQQLLNIAQFLHDDNVQDFTFCCALKNNGSFKQKKPSNFGPSHFYSKEQRIYVNQGIEEVVNSIKESNPDIAKYLYGYQMPLFD